MKKATQNNKKSMKRKVIRTPKITLILAVLIFACIGVYSVYMSQAATVATNIKVIQANIFVDLKPNVWKNELLAVMGKNPDVITVNEASYKSAADLELNGYKSVGAAPGRPYQQDARVLWKHNKRTLKDSGREQLSDSDVKGGNRYANWATLRNRADGTKFVTVISVHTLQSPLSSVVRKRLLEDSMKKLQEIVNERKEVGPVIIGGDLNLDYQILKQSTNPWMPRRALKDNANAVSTYAEEGKPASWITSKKGKSTIDYIFYSRDTTIDTGSYLKLSGHNLMISRNSDHNYVIANFRLY